MTFTCGLLADPSPLLEHLADLMATATIESLRTKVVTEFFHELLLNLVASEGKVKSGEEVIQWTKMANTADQSEDATRVHPLWNEHFCFVTEFPAGSIKGRLVAFFEQQDESMEDICPAKPEVTKPRDCDVIDDVTVAPAHSIIAEYPELAGRDVLEVISDLKQTTVDLCLNALEVTDEDDITDLKYPVFRLDPGARSVSLFQCELPADFLKDLGKQITTCPELRLLLIKETPHVAQELVSDLDRLTQITHLHLASELSQEHCSVLVQKVRCLTLLEELYLDEAQIGTPEAESLAESIHSWGAESPLKEYHLRGASPNNVSCGKLLQALAANCKQLETLYLIPKNVIGGVWESLPSPLEFPKLQYLNMKDTGLSGQDVQFLAGMASGPNALPGLTHLMIGFHNGEKNLRTEPREVREAFHVLVKKVKVLTVDQKDKVYWDKEDIVERLKAAAV